MIDVVEEDAPNEPDGVGLSPYVFAEAARGSVDAFRKLRDYAADMAIAGTAPFDQAFAVAETFARLAASHNDPADRKRLAGLLMLRPRLFPGAEEAGNYSVAQAIAQLDAAADEGDADATAILTRVAEGGVTKSVFDLARDLREQGATA